MLNKLLTTSFELCENANKIDYGLHDKPKKKFNFWLYWNDLKAEFKILFRL